MIDAAVLQQVLDELFSPLETLETQNEAILQFLKDRGVASDEDLAAFREKASHASSVRWRAARIRVNHLLSQEESRQAADAKKDQKAIQEPPRDRMDSEEHASETERNATGSGNQGGGNDRKKKDDDQRAQPGKPDKAANKDAA